jgi:hypothetical protein
LLPAGYLFKKVGPPPAGFNASPHIADICSVSSCVVEPFADYLEHWRHNALFFFDNPSAMRDLAQGLGVDLSGMTLLYFELHPEEFDQDANRWNAVEKATLPMGVLQPKSFEVLGFDVVSYSRGVLFECSPLSCNGFHAELSVNGHCLFPTFDAAWKALETGKFDGAEPGPYRIFSVARVDAQSS